MPSPSPLPPSLFLCSPRSEPLLPLSFYAFLPAKDPLSSGCRWVYRQPVGISVSARSVVWGMDEFCKSPFFFSRPLPVVRLSPFSPACPGQPLARRCVRARRAFKRQKRPDSPRVRSFLARPARLCARFSQVDDAHERVGPWNEHRPSLKSRRADKVVSGERKRVAFDSNSLSQYRRFFPVLHRARSQSRLSGRPSAAAGERPPAQR